jgi:aryl carrier-like protein
MYGITETTVHATWRPLGSADLAMAASPASPIGRPLPHLQVHLLDCHGRLVPPGVAGEMHVGGTALARAYLGRPELTAERFLPDPFAGTPGERAYRTGDLGRLDAGGGRDGEIEYLGRTDHQVKVRGFRVELGEIEQRLELHPAVREAAVVLVEENAADPRLVAYVVPASAEDLKVDDLKGTLRRMLPEHMVPAAFVVLPRMPLLSNGKIDRAALPSPSAAVPPIAARAPFVAPRTPVERRLVEIWSDVLKRESLGILDNFFELGGHSIHSIQLTHRATESGLPLTPRNLLERPTIAELAALFEAVEIPDGIAAPLPAESGEWEEGQL